MKNKHTDIAIQLTNVSKKYEIHHEKPTLVEKFVKGSPPAGGETFWALRDINLTIKKGERVGIVGPNGSGKTTLLKIISGITTPTNGEVKTYGKVVSLIDLEAGFHDDLTGEQNIYLNGMLLGMSREEIAAKAEKIIGFADIKQFIDAPLFTYSQGMKLRLGFSVAIAVKPDILILDEQVAAGDANFREKSDKVIKKFTKNGITAVVVSHWLEYIKSRCSRILTMRSGQIAADETARTI